MRPVVSALDLRLGLRMLVKHPGLTLVGGLGMAVSIAIGAGSFAFFHSHLYPRVPLEEGERIVALENRDVEVNNEDRRALHDFPVWRDEMRTVTDVGAFRTVSRNLLPDDGPAAPVPVAEMTASGFTLARVPPLLGRYLVEEDEREGAPPVVVVGYDVWRTSFASDPAVVGREIRFGTAVHTIVGVMPEGFAFPVSHRFWTPLRLDPADHERGEGPEIHVFGRLAPGATLADARAEIDAIGRRAAAAFPESHARLRAEVHPYTYSQIDIQGSTGWTLARLQLLVSLLLVVVALNVAVLVYARTATRRAEIAVRTALGASRRRVVGQLFAEALVLTGGAAALGLPLAQLGLRQGNAIMEQETGVPFWTDYGLRSETVLYTVGLALLAAVIVGVLPALQATGGRLGADLRQLGGGTGMRLGRTWTALIVAQVAVAVAALPSAVSLGLGELEGATARPTYPAAEFLAADLGLEADAGPDALPGSRVSELMRRLEAEPGVAGVTYRANAPGPGGRVLVEGEPAPAESQSGHRVSAVGVDPGYFEVFGAATLTGRGLDGRDLAADATSVVVNRAFVRRVLGGGPAVGRRVRYAGAADADATEPERWYEIVGVMEDLQANPLDPEEIPAALVHAVAPERAEEPSLVVRLRGPAPSEFAARLSEVAAGVDPSLRLDRIYSLDEADRQAGLAVRLVGLVLALVVLSVFLLSAAGVYALVSFTVTQRRREIGIRTALGAHPGQVLRSVFSRAARQIGLGLAAGVAGAALLEAASGGAMLDGRGAVLLPLFAAAMAAVGLLAALGPARKGLRIEPTEALRADA